MTIKNEQLNFSEYAYKIDMAGGAGYVIDRRFPLKNGESVTIHVEIDGKESDLEKINVQSIERAIEILRAWLPEE
ncbi:hypothetical protein BLA13014_03842 [Burkholderia aenigmatica]|uniref:Uncharacterized protein n=1 Tax=Burkholderia aenigmatica TaxID=2015348 RepID=A0A6P2MMY0_9BURK|nr:MULTISPECIES: hypothetical protein [Burkholderia]VWB83296.1 hypothetical protein BLA13014_03842 [Burkholderia aenigmatica]